MQITKELTKVNKIRIENWLDPLKYRTFWKHKQTKSIEELTKYKVNATRGGYRWWPKKKIVKEVVKEKLLYTKEDYLYYI